MGRLISPGGPFSVTALAFALVPLATRATAEEAGEAVEKPAVKGAPKERFDKPLDEVDVRAIRALFQRFAAAMTAGDADALGELLSPTLPPNERRRIVSRARGEFERMLYRRFVLEVGESPAVDRLVVRSGPPVSPAGPKAGEGDEAAKPVVTDRIEILVLATYEYETCPSGTGGGGSLIAGTGETAYPFRLVKIGGEWRIVWSELIDQFETKRMERFLGWMFLTVFLAVAAVFFCGWMALDAWVRTGRAGYSLAVLFTPPVGPLVYFVAVYLRRGFVRRETD